MMRGGRARNGMVLLLALAAVGGLLAPALGIPGGPEEGNQKLCGNTLGCHGLTGANTSLARVEMSTDTLTVHAGQFDVPVYVNVTGAEQKTGDPIGVTLVRDIRDPLFSLPQLDGWVILVDPLGQSPGYNYAKVPSQGTSGNTSASYTWSLQAPPDPGDYRLMVRMQTGKDEEDANPVSRDEMTGLLFHVVPPPQVLDTTPRDNSTGVYVNTPVVLVFNKDMDRPTVEAAFSIDPPVNGTLTWEGSVARFIVQGFLEEGTNYTFDLSTDAFDADGIRLLEPLSVNFTTGSGVDVYPPQVVSIISSRAPLDAVVRIAFNEPMDRASVLAAFSIAPPVEGAFSWDMDTFVFTPDRDLDYDTLHTVRIAGTALDLGGNALASDVYSTFLTVKDTDPPEVLATLPSNGYTEAPLVINVTLFLSPDVDVDTLASALTWDPPTSVDVTWEGSNATLDPRHLLETGTRYNLTVGTSLRDIRGNPMVTPFVLTFVTAGSTDRTPPYLVQATPPAGSNVPPGGTVRLEFSEPMDRLSVETAIMVSPLAETSASWSGQTLTLTLDGLELGTVYTVNIDSSIEDLAGNTALEPYALRYLAAHDPVPDRPVFYVENWLETWWDLALVVALASLVVVVAVVQARWGWRRVVLTAFAWVEERARTARYMGEARRLYYSINRQMPHSHAERYGSKTVWYWYPFYCLGGIALLSFVICGITGMVLALYYVPSTEGSPSAAYGSIEHIMEEVSFGYMFRAIHHWSANIMIAAVVLHMLRVYFTGAYRNPRELNWVAGVFLLGLTLFYGYSGYLLPWNQLSYWAGTIGLEMCRTVPLMGDWFAELIFGGISLGAATLTRMYFVHVLFLPIATITLMVVHLLAVYIQGLAEPH